MQLSAKIILPQPGELVAGKYRIERSLGQGGMAHVFAAHHELLDRPIALKVLSRISRGDEHGEKPSKNYVDRFLVEARAAARIDSPYVTRVMEIGTLDNGLPYMVMERLVGCDLEELLARQKQLPIGATVDYVLQALDGIAHAHALGIIHRDLKPANLFLCDQPDGSAIVKVMDFGIAKFTEPDARAGKLTGEGGAAIGSPMYMAPEQIRNASTVDERADVWALGVVLYELLAGVTPFEGEGVGEIFAGVLETAIVRPRKLRPEIPQRLDDAIMLCLDRDVGRRCSDVADLARRLAPFAAPRWAPLVKSIEQTLALGKGRSSGVRPAPSGPRITTEATETLDHPGNGPKRASRGRAVWLSLGGVLAAGGIALGWIVTKPGARHPTHTAPSATETAAPAPEPASSDSEPITFELPDQPSATTASSVIGRPARGRPTASMPTTKSSATARPSATPGSTNYFDQRF